jgi:aspartyl-tRNA(Asn)/glutamyl-tRNA(Gln) amidotransferase subunit A
MPSEVSSNLARYDGIRYGMRIFDAEDSEVDFIPENRALLDIYLDSRRYGLGEEIKKRIMLGTYALSSGYYDAYYLRAQKVRTLVKEDFEKVFFASDGGVDFILTPTTPTSAFKLGEKTEDPLQMYLEDIFTVTANIAGVPAISLPSGTQEMKNGKSASRRMPIGIQLTGKWFDEEGLLNTAFAYEQKKNSIE